MTVRMPCLLRPKLLRKVFNVLSEDVRSGCHVERHGDHGALAGHLEDGVGKVSGLGPDLVDAVPVLVELLAPHVFRRVIQFGFACCCTPLVLFLAG
ncbi:hypothetical protein D3C78_1699040 [compost metagenome]